MTLLEYLKEKYPAVDFSAAVLFDTETTGFKFEEGHRIVEFGAVGINAENEEDRLHLYFNPDRDIDIDAVNTHGLTVERLEEEPEFYLKAKEILTFLKGRPVIAHNAKFDESFIDGELMIASRRLEEKLGTLKDYCVIVDSLELAKLIFPTQRINLDALCSKLGVDKTGRKFHGALLDSCLLRDVFNKMLKLELSDVYDDNKKPYFDDIQVTPLDLKKRPRVVEC
ncbi:exonuclease domain-containing protein [Aeromonas sp. 23P]|uniref:exonuclease domain-containing protein n=1 Tax=Aeromonas sp. 23P TaxID=3452716 RepID=UPI003F79814D